MCAGPGERLAAPAGRYALRAIADGLSLAANDTLTVRARSRSARTRTIPLALTPGGRVTAASAVGPLEVLSLETGRRETLLAPRDAEVPVPAGRALAILGEKGKTVAGFTRPVSVSPGEAPAALAFEPPAAGHAHVLARVDYPAGIDGSARDVRVLLGSPAGSLTAGAATNAGGQAHHSAFYDVPAGGWNVEVVSDRWWAVPVPVEVRGGSVAIVEGLRLLPRPTLTVELDVHPSLASERRRLALYRCAPGEWSTAGRLDPERCPGIEAPEAADRAVFERIAPTWHVLETRVGAGRSRVAVDLRAGSDLLQRVTIEPTVLTGRIRRGRQNAAAELHFERLEDPSASAFVRSESDGLYRASLWPQGVWRVRIKGAGIASGDAPVLTLDLPRPGALARSFELPPTEILLTVVDEKTQEAVPRAEVAFLSFGTARWRSTDDLGELRLSAVAAGRLELTVDAEGYRTRQASMEVEDSGSLQSLEVRLAPLEMENAFRAILASGAPASGARVVAGLGGAGIERERAVCDAEGICPLAERPPEGETLLIAHPEAGVTAVAAAEVLTTRRVRLSPPGGILRVRPLRGEKTADSLLQVFVAVRGATLPPAGLDNVAIAIARPSRTAIFPGAVSGFFLSGLPAGPVLLTVAASARGETGSFDTPEVVAGPIVIELPSEGVAEIELP